MHKITRATLAAFIAAHQAAANTSYFIRAHLVNRHVKALKAMVKRADARTERLRQLSQYHQAEAKHAEVRACHAWAKAAQTATNACQEAARHGVDVTF